ncbi:MAG TPA: hypothetical protein DEP91_06270 [Sphingomonas bacterium]|uniref:Polysaccharide biosynthesis protein GumE n=1 Tax=Sphingomonas bacterium TaxID=1895847 RepID=A0A3D0WAK8_9SPHN|nr:hypothetical protein [Sphingomonas bacterium]
MARAAASPKAVARVSAERFDQWLVIAAIAIMAAGLLFNFGAAWVNANVAALAPSSIVLIQGALLAGAFAVGVLGGDRDRLTWLLILWLMIVWWVGLSLFRQAANPKYLGDIAAFPIFVLMGTVVRLRMIPPFLVVIQILAVVIGLWEAIDPVGYGVSIDVAKYYANTRGVEATIYDPDLTGLYLNATRPVGRLLLPQLGIHRVSSLFLEPVSLGNWTVVVTIFLCTLWRRMALWMRVVLIGGNAVLLVMCDGRFAIIASVAVIGACLIAPKLPRGITLAFPPATMILLAIVRALGALPSGGDTLSGRLAKSLYYFERQSLTELFGLNASVPGYTFDSGWTYFAQTQSVLGFIAFWCLLCLMLPLRTVEAKRFIIGVTLFFALSMPVSNSFISIKAAGVLFVCYGCLRRWQREEGVDDEKPALAPPPAASAEMPRGRRPALTGTRLARRSA